MSDVEPAPSSRSNAMGAGQLTAETASGLELDAELKLATGKDRLQLGIARQHRLGTDVVRMGEHALHLTRAANASLRIATTVRH